MVKTASAMIPLGTKAPQFALRDVITGKMISPEAKQNVPATVICFICNHCPYVRHINHGLVVLARKYMPKGVSFIAINANDVAAYPDDAPEHMKQVAQDLQYPFPYVFDETQEVARAYVAACTPDFYVFDGDLALVYRGQFDDSRPGNEVPVTGKDIGAALDAVLSRKTIDSNQKPSLGCNIKWK